MDLSRTWAIVPLRGLATAKTRLAASLDPEARLALVILMASRTLRATRDADGLAGTVLVTADPAAARLAESFGARTLVQRLPGLNAALHEARGIALDVGATATLVVPIDLQAINSRALDDMLNAVRASLADNPSRPVVAVVPDRHGLGTNAMLTSPPDIIEPAFGDESLAAHRAAALAAGARWLELGGPLTLDLDTAADLLETDAMADPVPTHARAGSTDAA